MYFFFQAEDGIRNGHVTGVQTCALPILDAALSALAGVLEVCPGYAGGSVSNPTKQLVDSGVSGHVEVVKIGRASCRERVWIEEVEGDENREKIMRHIMVIR